MSVCLVSLFIRFLITFHFLPLFFPSSDQGTTETRNGPFTPLSFSQGDATVVHSTLPPVHPLSIPSNPLLIHGTVSQLHPDKAANMLSFPRKIGCESNTQNLKAQSIPPSDAPSEKQESIPSSSTSRILHSVQFLDGITFVSFPLTFFSFCSCFGRWRKD